MTKYKLQLCNDMQLWDTFVNESPQGTVFNNTNFLSTINSNNNYYKYCYNKYFLFIHC